LCALLGLDSLNNQNPSFGDFSSSVASSSTASLADSVSPVSSENNGGGDSSSSVEDKTSHSAAARKQLDVASLAEKYLKPQLELNAVPKPFFLKKAASLDTYQPRSVANESDNNDNANAARFQPILLNKVSENDSRSQLNDDSDNSSSEKTTESTKSTNDDQDDAFKSEVNAYLDSKSRRNSTKITNGRLLLKVIEGQINNKPLTAKDLADLPQINVSKYQPKYSPSSSTVNSNVNKPVISYLKLAGGNSPTHDKTQAAATTTATVSKPVVNDFNNNKINFKAALAKRYSVDSASPVMSAEKYKFEPAVRAHVAKLDDPSKPSVAQSRTFRLLQETLNNGNYLNRI
jgi:hypothetical protein